MEENKKLETEDKLNNESNKPAEEAQTNNKNVQKVAVGALALLLLGGGGVAAHLNNKAKEAEKLAQQTQPVVETTTEAPKMSPETRKLLDSVSLVNRMAKGEDVKLSEVEKVDFNQARQLYKQLKEKTGLDSVETQVLSELEALIKEQGATGGRLHSTTVKPGEVISSKQLIRTIKVDGNLGSEFKIVDVSGLPDSEDTKKVGDSGKSTITIEYKDKDGKKNTEKTTVFYKVNETGISEGAPVNARILDFKEVSPEDAVEDQTKYPTEKPKETTTTKEKSTSKDNNNKKPVEEKASGDNKSEEKFEEDSDLPRFKIVTPKTEEEQEDKPKETTTTKKSPQDSPSRTTEAPRTSSSSSNKAKPQFGSDGLLIMEASSKGQQVVNYLLGPGTGYVTHTQEMDAVIDSLTTPQALWVIHRIEGAGFGQTAAGYAGVDSSLTHQKFVEQQLNLRFGGSVHELLKKWGTYSYPGY